MSVMKPVNTPATRQTMAPSGRMSALGAGKQTQARAVSGGGSLLARPTEASVALSTGSAIGKKAPAKPVRKELTFKQQLLKKTLKDSAIRPCGVLALHIKQGHFHDIDTGGMCVGGA